MKNVILALVFVSVAALGLGALGFWMVMTYLPPVPISYVEMERLQEQQEIPEKEIPRLLACFERNDEDLRLQAALTLSKMGAKAVDPVRSKLQSRNPKVRFCAVETLAWIGPPAAKAADDLVGRLSDDNAEVRYKAVYALGKIDVHSAAVINGLLKAMSDPDEAVKETAIEALEKIGAPPAESLPALMELASKSPTPNVRSFAIKLLGRMGEPAAPAFKELLKISDPLEKIALIQGIAQLGPQAKPLLPEVQMFMVKNRWWDAQEELLLTFKKCGPDGAQGLISVLKELHDPKSPHFAPNDERSSIVIKTIGEMGPEAKAVVPTLIEFLNDKEVLRPQILQALGDIGPAAGAAIPAVEALTKDERLAGPARVALRRMGVIEKK